MTIDFDKVINRMGTYSTQWDFASDRFGKSDVLPFSISDMDFRSPPEIIHAIEAYTKHGVFGYTRWNHDGYKSAIQKWYKDRFSTKIDGSWIVYSPSVIYTIARLIEITTQKNEQVILQTPGYDAFFKQIKASGRELIKNPLEYCKGNYKIDFNLLEKQLSHPKAKVLLFCNPHNPTGRVWKEKEMHQIVELCHKYNVKIISDDIHMDIVYRNNKYRPITDFTKYKNDVMICTSASKVFNTPSLGGSYAFIPDEQIRERFLDMLKQRDGLSNATIFGVLSVIEGYNHSGYWVDELTNYVHNNMTIVSSFIKETLPKLSFKIPEATYLAWIDCSNLNASNEEIQNALIHIGNVGFISGEVYEAGKGKFLRMNVGCPKEKLMEGLERLKKSINSID